MRTENPGADLSTARVKLIKLVNGKINASKTLESNKSTVRFKLISTGANLVREFKPTTLETLPSKLQPILNRLLNNLPVNKIKANKARAAYMDYSYNNKVYCTAVNGIFDLEPISIITTALIKLQITALCKSFDVRYLKDIKYKSIISELTYDKEYLERSLNLRVQDLSKLRLDSEDSDIIVSERAITTINKLYKDINYYNNLLVSDNNTLKTGDANLNLDRSINYAFLSASKLDRLFQEICEAYNDDVDSIARRERVEKQMSKVDRNGEIIELYLLKFKQTAIAEQVGASLRTIKTIIADYKKCRKNEI